MFAKEVGGQLFDFFTCKLTDFNSSTFIRNMTQSCTGTPGFIDPEMKASPGFPNEQVCQNPAMDIYR